MRDGVLPAGIYRQCELVVVLDGIVSFLRVPSLCPNLLG